MKIYANENGDWWASEDIGVMTITIEQLQAAMKAEGYAPEEIENWQSADKIGELVREYGWNA